MKIIYLMGKSASGKDTIFKRLLEDKRLKLRPLITYTTRPMRAGEIEGDPYFFINILQFAEAILFGRMIEYRTYETACGHWFYGTILDEQFSREGDLLTVGTPESCKQLKKWFGEECVIPVYVEVETGERLQRALNRERMQQNPQYKEMCRRFIADEEDFSEVALSGAGVEMRFCNDNLEKCVQKITDFLLSIQKESCGD